jgi:hypothetical protein
MVAPVAMVLVTLPTVTHVLPLDEREAVNTLPTRCIRTQYGGLKPLVTVVVELPPVLLRRMKEMLPLASEHIA